MAEPLGGGDGVGRVDLWEQEPELVASEPRGRVLQARRLFVRRLGHKRFAGLVTYHQRARAEAGERGLLKELTAFREERSALAAALT